VVGGALAGGALVVGPPGTVVVDVVVEEIVVVVAAAPVTANVLSATAIESAPRLRFFHAFGRPSLGALG
jgi:hypothetical protein